MKTCWAWTAPGLVAAALSLMAASALAQSRGFSQGFNELTLPAGWSTINLSDNNATGLGWRTVESITDDEPVPSSLVVPFEGAAFAIANYQALGSGTGTINAWLLSPVISHIANGDRFSFFTTTVPNSPYPDRLELRLNTANTGTDVGTTPTGVGDFTLLLSTVNPDLQVGAYPESWTQVTATVGGLAAPTEGRIALRYFVTDGGLGGANSNTIGVDNFVYAPIPEPATWALAVVGLAGLAGWRRLRRR